ncbi:hypothetical protein C1645_545166 [Glomus cerebriforme]|uniref:Uncharacterized protein n=1 Tax=Glomus cerebriforme TaxID=658196 RepID=A0A397SBN0_9GLOM|nr:hypothetical protein C1645_545166 [Glomus cerebriforme]
MTEEKFRSYGLKGGPAMRLAKEVQALKEKPKRSFSSYRSLKEVLAKYGIEDSRITAIPQFTPKTHNIEDEDEALHHCINDIRIRINNMGTVADSNEAVRCEYISTMYPYSQKTHRKRNHPKSAIRSFGEESGGRVDFAIKCIEELIAITEGKQHQIGIGFAQNIMQCESAYQTNKRK